MRNARRTAKTSAHPHKNWKDNIAGKSDASDILSSLEGRDYSANTLRAIRGDVAGFLDWYKKRYGEQFSFERVTTHDIGDFRDDLQQLGRKPASVNRKLASLRLFFAEAVDRELLTKNPCKGIKRPVTQRLAPKGLTREETSKLLREVAIRGRQRDTVLIELMLGAGLRVSEVVNLKRDDIVLSERKGHLMVRSSKGNKDRSVPLRKKLRGLLREHLKGQRDSEHVFVGQRGALKAIAINKIVDKYGEKAGVRLSPHSLRHTFAFNYLRNNPGDIVGLAQILGHSNVNTTAIYTQNRLEDLQEKVERVVF